MSRIDKYVSTSRIDEMAAIDFKDIDLKGSAESIAKQFVDNYKKRTGKDFNAQAAAGIKKTLKDREDVDAIVAAARKYGEVKEAKPHAVRSKESNEKKKEANAEKNDVMSKNVGAAAKRAYDAYTKEDFISEIRKNSGLEVLEEGKGKTAKCPTCGEKYLVQTGYCLSCKKKVADMKGAPKASVATDGGCESKKDKKKKPLKEAKEEQTFEKNGMKVYRTDGVVFYKGSEYKIPKEVVALKDVK